MASQFAQAYRNLAWQAIYASPLSRAVNTAKPLAEAQGIEIRLRHELREIDFGYWEGLVPSQLRQNHAEAYAAWEAEPAWNAPPGGESAYDVALRVMAVMREIRQTHRQGQVLVVTHKGTIRIALCCLLGIELGRYRDRIDAPAASLSMVKFSDKGPMLCLLGDRSYLPDDLKNRPGT